GDLPMRWVPRPAPPPARSVSPCAVQGILDAVELGLYATVVLANSDRSHIGRRRARGAMKPNETHAARHRVGAIGSTPLGPWCSALEGSGRHGVRHRRAGADGADGGKNVQGRRYRQTKSSVRLAGRPGNGEVMQTR